MIRKALITALLLTTSTSFAAPTTAAITGVYVDDTTPVTKVPTAQPTTINQTEATTIPIVIVNSVNAPVNLTGSAVVLTIRTAKATYLSRQAVVDNAPGGLAHFLIGVGDFRPPAQLSYTFDAMLVDSQGNPHHLTLPSVLTVNPQVGDPAYPISVPSTQSPLGTGPPGVNWRGVYSGGTSYVIDDGVSYTVGGATSSYRALQSTTGNLPTNSTYWALIASGAQGSSGTGVPSTDGGVAGNVLTIVDGGSTAWQPTQSVGHVDAPLVGVGSSSDHTRCPTCTTDGGSAAWTLRQLNGTATGTYTLAAPILSGTVTGTFTLQAPTLAGTILGTYVFGGSPSVAGALTIHGYSVDPGLTPPVLGQMLAWNGSAYVPTTIVAPLPPSSTGSAITYYVRSSGNDSNDCSIGTPCLTTAHVLSIIPHFLGNAYIIEHTGYAETISGTLKLPMFSSPGITATGTDSTFTPFGTATDITIRANPTTTDTIGSGEISSYSTNTNSALVTINTTRSSFTPNALVGQWLQNGANLYQITSNTTSAVEVAVSGSNPAGPLNVVSLNGSITNSGGGTVLQVSGQRTQLTIQGMTLTSSSAATVVASLGIVSLKGSDIGGLTITVGGVGTLTQAYVHGGAINSSASTLTINNSLVSGITSVGITSAANVLSWSQSVFIGCAPLGQSAGNNSGSPVEFLFNNLSIRNATSYGIYYLGGPGSDLINIEIKNSVGNALTAIGPGLLYLSNVGGTGNGGYGIQASRGTQVELLNNTTVTVTGTSGDFIIGTRPVRTWSDFANTTFPRGIESDMTGDGTRMNSVASAGFVLPPGIPAVATSNLPTPSAINAGMLVWDSTALSLKRSDGSSWVVVAGGSTFSGSITVDGVVFDPGSPSPTLGQTLRYTTKFAPADDDCTIYLDEVSGYNSSDVGPAMATALTSLFGSGSKGGVLCIPNGSQNWTTPETVNITGGQQVIIRGLTRAAAILPNVGSTNDMLTITHSLSAGLGSVVIWRDLHFVGIGSGTIVAQRLINSDQSAAGITGLENVTVTGMTTKGAVFLFNDGVSYANHVAFNACSGGSGLGEALLYFFQTYDAQAHEISQRQQGGYGTTTYGSGGITALIGWDAPQLDFSPQLPFGHLLADGIWSEGAGSVIYVNGATNTFRGDKVVLHNVKSTAGDLAIFVRNVSSFEASNIHIGNVDDAADTKRTLYLSNVGLTRVTNLTTQNAYLVYFDDNCSELHFKDSFSSTNYSTSQTTGLGFHPGVSIVGTIIIDFDNFGLKTTARLSDGTIGANKIVEPSTSNDGRVTLFNHTHDPKLAAGVALDATSGAAQWTRVAELGRQKLSLVSDGTSTFAPGTRVTTSSTVDGDVMPWTSGSEIGLSYSTAAATVNAVVKALFR